MYRRGLFLLLDNFSTTLFLFRIISHINKAYFFNNHLNQLKNILFDGKICLGELECKSFVEEKTLDTWK